MKPHTCQTCRRRFRNDAALADHMQSDAHKRRLADDRTGMTRAAAVCDTTPGARHDNPPQ